VNAEEGLYYCFGCRAAGNQFTFVREMQHVDFIEALRMLADRAGSARGSRRKLQLSLCGGILILPLSLLLNSAAAGWVLAGVPLYFAVSGMVTALGFSAILDAVPNRSRGLAMSMSFFLNVALGAGLGPTAVALAGAHVFTAEAGLGPPLVLTAIGGYGVAVAAVWAALFSAARHSR